MNWWNMHVGPASIKASIPHYCSLTTIHWVQMDIYSPPTTSCPQPPTSPLPWLESQCGADVCVRRKGVVEMVGRGRYGNSFAQGAPNGDLKWRCWGVPTILWGSHLHPPFTSLFFFLCIAFSFTVCLCGCVCVCACACVRVQQNNVLFQVRYGYEHWATEITQLWAQALSWASLRWWTPMESRLPHCY